MADLTAQIQREEEEKQNKDDQTKEETDDEEAFILLINKFNLSISLVSFAISSTFVDPSIFFMAYLSGSHIVGFFKLLK